MLRSIGIALVVQETVARVEVGGNGAGKVRVEALHRIEALGVVGVAIDQHRVAVVPENLESETLAETPLQFDLHTVEAAVAGRRIQRDVPVGLLVVRTRGHIGEGAGRQRRFRGGVPDVVRRRIVVVDFLLLLVAVVADVADSA